MTAILAILGSKWVAGALAAVVALIAAFVTGHFKGKQAGKQEAAGLVQSAQQDVADAKQQVAAATAMVTAVQDRQQADTQAAGTPDNSLDNALAAVGGLRKEDGQ